MPPLPWRADLLEKASSGKIKIGYSESLSTVPACSAARRAVHMAVEGLKKKGYEVVPIEFPANIV